MHVWPGIFNVRVALTGSGYVLRNGAVLSGFIVECNRATERSNRLAPKPSCCYVRTPTLDCASNLPLVYPSQACCGAGEQFFDDSFTSRP